MRLLFDLSNLRWRWLALRCCTLAGQQTCPAQAPVVTEFENDRGLCLSQHPRRLSLSWRMSALHDGCRLRMFVRWRAPLERHQADAVQLPTGRVVTQGPARLAHLSEYRLRPGDLMRVIYLITRRQKEGAYRLTPGDEVHDRIA